MPPLEDHQMPEDGDEEDLVVKASKPSLKCPLTQRLFEDPVKKYPNIPFPLFIVFLVLNVGMCFRGLPYKRLPGKTRYNVP